MEILAWQAFKQLCDRLAKDLAKDRYRSFIGPVVLSHHSRRAGSKQQKELQIRIVHSLLVLSGLEFPDKHLLVQEGSGQQLLHSVGLASKYLQQQKKQGVSLLSLLAMVLVVCDVPGVVQLAGGRLQTQSCLVSGCRFLAPYNRCLPKHLWGSNKISAYLKG